MFLETPRDVAFVDLLLERQQLPHEVEVGSDDGATRLDELVSVEHGECRVLHDIGDGDGGGARHAGLTVHQHLPSAIPNSFCKYTR